MENHPIPQDVTGFKFKLIGSMTVKQFLYLLGFGILTTIAFVAHISIFIKVPLMLFFAGIGSALAFLPIEGRPLDVMIANFAKTIPSENRYIFKKRGADLSSFGYLDHEIKPLAPSAQKVQVLATAPTAHKGEASPSDKKAALISRLRNSSFRPDDSEVKNLNNIHALFDNNHAVIPVVEAQNIPDEITQKVAEEIKEEKLTTPPQHQPVVDAVEKPEPVMAPKDNIKLAGEKASSGEGAKNMPQSPTISQTPNPTLSAGFPTLPDIGNVVLGIVRDPRAKSLPNILVEVLDSNQIPVRAFKTNALGQFAAATPLPNGSYNIHFEDPAKQHEFKAVDVQLSGQIFQPLEIVSIDAREKLRQELFGGMSAAASA